VGVHRGGGGTGGKKKTGDGRGTAARTGLVGNTGNKKGLGEFRGHGAWRSPVKTRP